MAHSAMSQPTNNVLFSKYHSPLSSSYSHLSFTTRVGRWKSHIFHLSPHTKPLTISMLKLTHSHTHLHTISMVCNVPEHHGYNTPNTATTTTTGLHHSTHPGRLDPGGNNHEHPTDIIDIRTTHTACQQSEMEGLVCVCVQCVVCVSVCSV